MDDADATASAASELKRASAEASESFRVAFDMEDFLVLLMVRPRYHIRFAF